ncbi:hypothetical protein CM19_04190 [Candidatus Acidianus copahuensis]|uniref:Amidohydrolase-related domain-containing protein n=1 Tax=Candidatus Acidianus copahuensis TaxID=1160895 RepID=A0A031LS76_9CREN|nr:amidohydrolase family protein [Candidatus Acidianus copahuensis]EZQ10354.1 hypothetical protein CM19_04190 [Candidatus Acidianus copahuensis]
MILKGRNRVGEPIEIEAEGDGALNLERVILPAFYDMHSHLENAYSLNLTGYNNSSSLHEAVERWAKVRDSLTLEELKLRIERSALIELFYGTTHIRVHADTCSKGLKSVKAAILAKEELSPYIDVQVVAFPEQGIFNCSKESFLEGSKISDLIGGKPEVESAEEHIKFITEIAEKLGKNLDVHVDQGDGSTKFSEMLLDLAKTHVALSHLTALHFYPEEYARLLVHKIKEKGSSVISSPLTAFYLNGGNSYPMPRGITRINYLLSAGVNVSLGHDDVINPFYPSGSGDMLHVLWMAMNIERNFDLSWVNLITENAEKEFGVKNVDYVVLEAKSVVEGLSTLLPRWGVIRKGKIVAKNSMEPKVLDLNPMEILRTMLNE